MFVSVYLEFGKCKYQTKTKAKRRNEIEKKLKKKLELHWCDCAICDDINDDWTSRQKQQQRSTNKMNEYH